MGVRLGARGFLGVHFWGLTHECRGRVEVNLQEIAERLFGAGGGTLVHTHFSKTQNSNYCRLLPSHAPARAVSVPGSPALCVWCCRWCCGRGAYHGAAAGLGCWVLVLWCWCWCCGACAVVPALWCWCCGAGAVVLVLWCLRCGAGAGAARRVACTVSVYPDWLYPA